MKALDRRTLAFTVPIRDGEKSWTVYIPSPSAERVSSIAPILSHIFSLKLISEKTQVPSPFAIIKDYDYFAREACDMVGKRVASNEFDGKMASDKMFDSFKAFLDVSISSAQAVGPEGKTIPALDAKLSNEALNELMGTFIFFYSLWRYAPEGLNPSVIGDFTTSLDITEFSRRLSISASGSGNSGERETP